MTFHYQGWTRFSTLPRVAKVMSLLDCFCSYHEIYTREDDNAKISFIKPFISYYFICMPKAL
jgi:hypothetical protein